MSKENFNNILGINHNLLYRSVYGNTYNEESKEMKDVKVYGSENFKLLSYDFQKECPFLSTESGSFVALKHSYLSNAFPNKTIYEK